jgi:hypothetical protein
LNSGQLWDKLNDKQKNYIKTMEHEEWKRRREERKENERSKRQKTAPAADHELEDAEIYEPGSNTAAERADYPTPPFKHLQPLHLTPENGPNRAAHQSGGQPRPTGAEISRGRRQNRFGSRNLNRGEPKESSQQVSSYIANELPKVAERVDLLNSKCNLGPTKEQPSCYLHWTNLAHNYRRLGVHQPKRPCQLRSKMHNHISQLLLVVSMSFEQSLRILNLNNKP